MYFVNLVGWIKFRFNFVPIFCLPGWFTEFVYENMQFLVMLMVVIFSICNSTVITQDILERKQGECYNNVCRRKEFEGLTKRKEELQWKIQELNELIRNKDKTINDLKRKYDSSTCGSSVSMTTTPTESSSTTVTMTTTRTLSSTEQSRQCQDPNWEAFLNSCYYVGNDTLTWANASVSIDV